MNKPHDFETRFSRRAVLQGAAALGAGAFGFRALPAVADVPNQYDGSSFQLKATEPNVKKGGVLRVGIGSRPPHFDIHQAGTINVLGTQACMYDNLIRHNPLDGGKTIIPDLAHSWDISKDGTSYTFFIRKDVLFHDGAELTAEDVKATYDRIIKPPPGISIPRTPLFRAVSEVNVKDKYTVEFKLAEPRSPSFMMASFASGWNVIVRKQTLEENNYNLRKVMLYPGTGPFRSLRRVENEVWVMERNPNYWNKGLPYLDGIEFYHLLQFSPELGASVLSNRVDYIRITDPVTTRKAKSTPGLLAATFNQSVIHGVWVNMKRKQLDDPRVRRAMALSLDRPVLIDVVKDVTPMQVGGYIYPFSEFATPKQELFKRIGYQEDPTAAVKEAQTLLAAAGQTGKIKELDFLVRDVASFKLWAQAIQAMLQQSLGIQTKLRTVVESVWFDDVAAGNYDLAIGAIVSTLLDPSDYFNAWYRTGGPQNYSGWSNKEFDDLVDQIDRETDTDKRKALVRKCEMMMENDPPVLPVAWEQINDVWWSYMKGHDPYDYFGVYDVDRYDTVWLDKA